MHNDAVVVTCEQQSIRGNCSWLPSKEAPLDAPLSWRNLKKFLIQRRACSHVYALRFVGLFWGRDCPGKFEMFSVKRSWTKPWRVVLTIRRGPHHKTCRINTVGFNTTWRCRMTNLGEGSGGAMHHHRTTEDRAALKGLLCRLFAHPSLQRAPTARRLITAWCCNASCGQVPLPQNVCETVMTEPPVQPSDSISVRVEVAGSGKCVLPQLQVNTNTTLAELQQSIVDANPDFFRPYRSMRLFRGHGGTEIMPPVFKEPCFPEDIGKNTAYLLSVVVITPALQREALQTLYKSTGGASWGNGFWGAGNRNWLSDAPFSEWAGLQTHPDGTVSEINLGNNNLCGTLLHTVVLRGRARSCRRVTVMFLHTQAHFQAVSGTICRRYTKSRCTATQS